MQILYIDRTFFIPCFYKHSRTIKDHTAEVGSNGSVYDTQAFNNSKRKETIDKGVLCLPYPEPLRNDENTMSFYIVADYAFTQKK